MMVRSVMFLAAGLLSASGVAHAEASVVRAFVGGWAYDPTGTITNTSQLDFEDDLALKSTDRKTYALGIKPGETGWLPALELDYTRIAADGRQTVSLVPAGTQPVFGALPISTDTMVNDRTDINDFELTALWPYRVGRFSFSGGLKIARLDGSVLVADQDTGQQQTQKINQTFPLLSIAMEWQPTESLRLSLNADYIQYKDNRADEVEARILWRFLGPVGLEGGYLQRRYKISDPMNKLDARVAGARIGMVIEIPY